MYFEEYIGIGRSASSDWKVEKVSLGGNYFTKLAQCCSYTGSQILVFLPCEIDQMYDFFRVKQYIKTLALIQRLRQKASCVIKLHNRFESTL